MSDKTPLEIDIEHRERFRTPLITKTVIVFLLISLCISTIYAFKLKRELANIEQEAVVMRENFNNERIELLKQIKQLQANRSSSAQDIN